MSQDQGSVLHEARRESLRYVNRISYHLYKHYILCFLLLEFSFVLG